MTRSVKLRILDFGSGHDITVLGFGLSARGPLGILSSSAPPLLVLTRALSQKQT